MLNLNQCYLKKKIGTLINKQMELQNDFRIYELRDADIWGPTFWNFLYLTATGFPSTLTPIQSNEFSRLLQNFYYFLPCIECRYHYYQMVKDLKITIKTRQEAFDMILNLHNQVRSRQNKSEITKEIVLSYHYPQRIGYICLILVILLLGIWYYKIKLDK